MSDVQLPWTTGKTVDAFVVNGSDQWYRADTHVFEAYNAVNFDAYKIALTEQGASGIYIGTLPTTGVTVGTYSVHARERQAGGAGSAVPGDPIVGGPTLMTYSGVAWSAFGGGGGGSGASAIIVEQIGIGVDQG
jgi:hypothetical protein